MSHSGPSQGDCTSFCPHWLCQCISVYYSPLLFCTLPYHLALPTHRSFGCHFPFPAWLVALQGSAFLSYSPPTVTETSTGPEWCGGLCCVDTVWHLQTHFACEPKQICPQEEKSYCPECSEWNCPQQIITGFHLSTHPIPKPVPFQLLIPIQCVHPLKQLPWDFGSAFCWDLSGCSVQITQPKLEQRNWHKLSSASPVLPRAWHVPCAPTTNQNMQDRCLRSPLYVCSDALHFGNRRPGARCSSPWPASK